MGAADRAVVLTGAYASAAMTRVASIVGVAAAVLIELFVLALVAAVLWQYVTS